MAELLDEELHLSPQQIRKAAAGKPVQLSKESVRGKTHRVKLHPHNVKKLHKARRLNKGCRLHLSHEELHGSGFFDFLRDLGDKVKQGWDWTKKNVVQTPFYQQNIRPLAHNVVQAGLAAAPVSGVAKTLLQTGADKLGEASEAFGMKRKRGRKSSVQHTERELVRHVDSQISPGQAGYIALPAKSYGDGVESHHIYHHFYMPAGGSFKLA